MPRSTREWAKRKLQESVDNLNWCGYHLDEVSSRYMAEHPEIANPLDDVKSVVAMLMDTILKIKGSF